MLTLIIIAITCLVSVSAFSNRNLFAELLFNGTMIHAHKQWHRFLTHAFVHADWVHLLMNMYVLYLFGSMVEKSLIQVFGTLKGEVYFFLLYFIGIVASSFPSYQKHKDDAYYNSVGASGAVSAVVFSAILLNPWMSLSLMFLPIPIPAPIFGILYLIYCWYAAKHSRDNIAHDVHYWGSLFGAVFTLVILPSSIFNLIDAIKDIF
ncbi:MAG: rhomboid family intramembrane serine protease [Bacteroidetes bacterium]|nr:rhomboid family intramembrane serine protease [Bacteroidota bacterium]